MKKSGIQLTIFMLSAAIFTFIILACNKSAYLDVKPDQRLGTPNTLEDLQAILDNDLLMNGGINKQRGVDPEIQLIGADDYYVPDNNFLYIPLQKNEYVWNDDIYVTGSNKLVTWDRPYQAIFYANVVLDGLGKTAVKATEQDAYNQIMGSALFYRSRFFFELAQVFSPQYDSATANTALGIVLRLKSDVNESIFRSTLQQTYDQIISDLKTSIPLLSTNPLFKTRPSRQAAYGMLAKTYLQIGDYHVALLYADSCLAIQSDLLDFNQLDSLANANIIPKNNPEIIYHSTLNGSGAILIEPTFISRIDSVLYDSYSGDDLRKKDFFKAMASNNVFYKGSFDGYLPYFSGMAVDEILLIRAESLARTGRITEAMADLNRLLASRWRAGTYVDLSAGDSQTALGYILTERRKELVGRGTRWSDLKRLNKMGAQITITRILDGQVYTLAPNELRYVYLIPPDIIAFHPDMQQNPR